MRFEEILKKNWHQPVITKKSVLLKAYQNDDFLVQIYEEKTGYRRLSINRTKPKGFNKLGHPIWEDGISWDELQVIKNALGFENSWLVECYPPDNETVNVANLRHLFLLKEPPVFGWHQKNYADLK